MSKPAVCAASTSITIIALEQGTCSLTLFAAEERSPHRVGLKLLLRLVQIVWHFPHKFNAQSDLPCATAESSGGPAEAAADANAAAPAAGHAAHGTASGPCCESDSMCTPCHLT